MKKKICFMLLITISATIYSQQKGAIVKGFVKNAETNEPISWANVIIKDIKLGVATNLEGYFEIINVPSGQYEILCYALTYPTYIDSINIRNTNEIKEINFHVKLGSVQLEPDSVQTKYHSEFLSSGYNDEVSITLDSLVQTTGKDLVYLTFTNNSPLTIYIIEDVDCIFEYKTEIWVDSDECLNPKIISQGCHDVVLNRNPKIKNLLRIDPNGGQAFLITKIRGHNTKTIKICDHKIWVNYQFKEKEELIFFGGFFDNDNLYEKYASEIYVQNQATRLDVTSSNYLTYGNK